MEKMDSKMNHCNILYSFKNVELPVFSEKQSEYILINDFEDFHNSEQEIADKIIENDKMKPMNIDKNFETEHKYIDFSHLIIGVKVKNMYKIESANELRFDDPFYASYMMKSYENDTDFYNKEAVQKIIDF